MGVLSNEQAQAIFEMMNAPDPVEEEDTAEDCAVPEVTEKVNPLDCKTRVKVGTGEMVDRFDKGKFPCFIDRKPLSSRQKKPVAFCHCYKHIGYLSKGMVEFHDCHHRRNGRTCPFFEGLTPRNKKSGQKSSSRSKQAWEYLNRGKLLTDEVESVSAFIEEVVETSEEGITEVTEEEVVNCALDIVCEMEDDNYYQTLLEGARDSVPKGSPIYQYLCMKRNEVEHELELYRADGFSDDELVGVRSELRCIYNICDELQIDR